MKPYARPVKKRARRAGRHEIRAQLHEAVELQPPLTVEEIADARYERQMQEDLMQQIEDERALDWDPNPYEYEEHVLEDPDPYGFPYDDFYT